MIQNNTKRWINTRVEYQWSDELGKLVQLAKEGYWYEGEMTLCITFSETHTGSVRAGHKSGGHAEAFFSGYTDSYAHSGKFGWNEMRLGNNGNNHLVFGANSSGGTVDIYVNNTSNPDAAINGNKCGVIDVNGNWIIAGGGSTAGTAYNHSSGRGNLSIEGTSNSIINWGINGTRKAYIHHDNTNLRIINVHAGYLSLGTSETDRMTIISSGYVGIGTTAPSAGLTIDAAQAGWRGQFMLKDDTAGNNADAYMTFWSGDETGSGATGLLGQVGFMSSSTNSLSIRNYMQGYTLLNEGGGNVGIGTTAPSSLLHCSQSTAYTPTLTLDHTGAAHGGGIRMLSSGAAADADRLGHIQFDGQNDNSENIRYVEMHSYAVDVSDGTEDGKFVINTYVAGTYGERFSIVSGNVGIGVAAPASLLHVAGSVQVGIDDTGHDVIFYGASASSNLLWDESADKLILNDSQLFLDQDDNVVALNIDSEQTSTNCVSINSDQLTTGYAMDISADSLTTGGALKIDSNSNSTGTRNIVDIVQNHASASGSTVLRLQQDGTGDLVNFFDGGTEVFTILDGGNVGIAATAPSYKLEVAGTFYSSGSSIEYKEDVEPYTPPEGALMGLKPVQYQYKDAWKDFGKRYSGNSSKQLGFVAEDVAKVLPELAVTKTENGEEVVRNVDYEKLTVLLVSEVQKLRTELDEIKNN